jgi:hypothetical protein
MSQLPGGASTYTAAGCVVGSERRPVWFGLVAGAAAASATFWGSSGSTGGASSIITLNALAGTTVPMIGPFVSACGVYVGNITTGSAFVWMR